MLLQLERAWIDELKIHDVDDLAWPYQLRTAQRTKAPRRVEANRYARHGTVDRTRPLFGAQSFTLAGTVIGDDIAETQDAYDALLGVLGREGQRLFRFLRRGRTEEEQAIVTLQDGPDAPTEGYDDRARYAVTIVGPDPRIYTTVIRTNSYDPTASLAGGGAAMPLVFPIVFSATTATSLTADNQGTAPTPPRFTISGPVTNPIVDNDSLGVSIVTTAQLGASDELIIDTATRDVLLNGAQRKDLISPGDTAWWELQPGENLVRLRGSGMVADQTQLLVAWRDARW